MNLASEAAQIRRRHDDLASDSDRLPPDPAGAPESRLCKTVSLGSYPTSPQRVYALVPVSPAGNETENATPTLTSGSDTLFGLNVGGSVPPINTYVVATRLDRWVFQYG